MCTTRVKTCCSLALATTLVLIGLSNGISAGMLFPQESESRQIHELNGFWDFRADNSTTRDRGLNNEWFKQRLSKTGAVISMPVPSSYNDITTEVALRDFVGWVWYDRDFYPSQDWKSKRIMLRFDSAHYNTIVWMNGVEIMKHAGGHLPFECAINDHAILGQRNFLTVAINNTLTPTTLPPGTITFKRNSSSSQPTIPILPTAPNQYPSNYFVQNVQFDFFNYAGIHRRVRLYTTPKSYVDDITIITNIQGSTGLVQYDIIVGGAHTDAIKVELVDADDNLIGVKSSLSGTFMVAQARLWWPHTMSEDYGYQYTLKVSVGGSTDVYRQLFGIRTVSVTKTQILINSKNFYCHGVNKHEDADTRGKGLDHAIIARDFALMKWLGVNCLRTSHYPYAEEFMNEADKQGFAVIDECPGVGIKYASNMGPESLSHHMEVMTEMIQRDKNRPGVIAWSVANEPGSQIPEADHYFSTVIEHTRKISKNVLPVTFVCSEEYDKDTVAKYVDFLCVNRYYSWYSDMGHLEVIPYQLSYDLEKWYEKIEKPIIIAEYGADTIPGLNSLPSQMFTEDYQLEFNQAYHAVFDKYRNKFLVGELIWNFADFMTTQSLFRAVGNRKGVITRQREPKSSAWQLKQRYFKIIDETQSSLTPYRKPTSAKQKKSLYDHN